jgi:hypothetical protein
MVLPQPVRATFRHACTAHRVVICPCDLILLETVRTVRGELAFLQAIGATFGELAFLQTSGATFGESAFLQAIGPPFGNLVLFQSFCTIGRQLSFLDAVSAAFRNVMRGSARAIGSGTRLGGMGDRRDKTDGGEEGNS